jgi:predicted glycoside hydrolase/deacetylase ChbG (UPF0249 family)
MRRVIVNADDFGLTPAVSRGILAAHRHGIVTSTTVLVNASTDRELLAELVDSGLGVGIHVNLTLGAPLTRARSLVDASGRFVRDARRVAAAADSRDVEREIEAQIERFIERVGLTPSHLDSHHHVGLHPPVREVLLASARRLGVPVRSQDAPARARARALQLRTPDHFFGESGPEPYWSLATVLRHLRELPAGVSEFMTHPGWFDDALRFSRYGRQREVEMVGLGTPPARAAAHGLGITLCDFRALSVP